MQVLRAGLALAVVMAFHPAAAIASDDYREAHDAADLSTSLRTCHIGLSISSRDQNLATGLPNTNARIRMTASGSCVYMSQQPNASQAVNATTSEYLVDAAPRAVMA